MSPNLTLDAGALIALERGDRQVIAYVARTGERDGAIVVPATALAQVLRSPKRQVRLTRLIRQPSTQVVALDRADATYVGRMLAVAGARDVVDAHVALCARRSESVVLTSDPDDLRAIDPHLRIVAV